MINFYEEDKSEDHGDVFGNFEERMERRKAMADNDVQFRDWVVYKDGTMINVQNHNYTIAGDRLEEDSWIAHMKGKTWCDMNTFLDAYFFALMVRKSVTELKITIH